MTSPELFPRYQTRIPEWDRFAEACLSPAPITLRANPFRTTPQALADRLQAAGFEIDVLEWDPHLLRVNRPVGRSLEHWLGHFYVQEANQALPVIALDPQPGETVLDLCAAPGGKTTQAAAAMENSGILIANEPNGRRQMSLLANVNRLGTLNVTITEYRGESLPLASTFDRVLVDAPCSGEGTVRKEPSLRGGATRGSIQRLSRLQTRLIHRAYDLVRPGGVLVYSTCTFAPEENEAVIAELLESRDARLTPISLPFEASSGWTDWEGESFPTDLRQCVRVYPHHLDSGGGFVVRIERPAS